MKKPEPTLFSRLLGLLAGVVLLGFMSNNLSAQCPQPNVEANLVQDGSELVIQLKPDAFYDSNVAAFQITVKYNSAVGLSLGTPTWEDTNVGTYMGGIALTNFFGTVQNFTDGGFDYVNYSVSNVGLATIASTGQSWPANTAIDILRIPIINTNSACVVFTVVDDAFTVANNLEYYISLQGCDSQNGVFGNVVAPVLNLNTLETFCTIQSAIDAVTTLDGHTLRIAPDVFSEDVNVSKELHLIGHDGAPNPRPLIDGSGSAAQIITVSAENVTLENLNIEFDQATELHGIKTTASGSYTGLEIKDCVISGTGTTGAPVFGSYGVLLGSFGGVLADETTITDNTIEHTGTSPLGRAIRGWNSNGTWSGNTLSAWYSIQVGDIDGGLLEVTGNNLTGVAEINNLASAGIHTFQNNDCYPSNAYGAGTDFAQVELKNLSNPAASLNISGNTFNDYTNFGIFSGRANNVVVDNNVFTPEASSATYRSVWIDTKQRTTGGPEAAFTVGMDLTNNTLNGNGVAGGAALQVANSDDVSTVGIITLGTAGNENEFAANNDQFILLSDATGATGAPLWGGLFVSNQSKVDAGIDATNNTFGGTLPSAMTDAELFDVEDKMQHGIDDGGLGFVLVKAGNSYVTPSSFTASTATPDLQRGVDASGSGFIMNVEAGVYANSVAVDKTLDIRGPNYGISPNGGPRVAEAIIHPGVTQSDAVFAVQADNVLIDGFTIDGDNPAIATGWTGTNGADIDAFDGVVAADAGNTIVVNGLEVRNNIMTNLMYFAVDIFGWYNYANPATSGHIVENNLFTDLGAYGTGSGYDFWGGGVLIYNDNYTKIQNNVMTNVRIGVQTGNFHSASPGLVGDNLIANNDMQVRRRGVFHNLFTGSPSPYTLSANNITALDDVNEVEWDGILLSSLTNASTTIDNTIDGAGLGGTYTEIKGVEVWNVDASTPADIIGGTISNVLTGVFINNYEGYSSNAGNGAHAALSNMDITATEVGIRVLDSPSSTSNAPVAATVNNCFVTSGEDAIRVEETVGGTATCTANDNQLTAGVGFYTVNATTTTNVFEATCNWHGSAANLDVLASSNGNVNVTPFLVNGTDDAPGTDGFQPVAGSCSGLGPVVSDSPADSYFTIQAGVDGSNPGATLTIEGGLFGESVVVNKAMTLNGANVGVDGCSGARVAETTVNGGGGTAITVAADGVVIDGLELKGLRGTSSDGFNNVIVRNNLIEAAEVGIASAAINTGSGPYTINNNCISMVGAELITFDTNPTLTPGSTGVTPNAGEWGADRYEPFGFVSESFDGDNRLKHSIDASACQSCRPGGLSSGFYNTQGRQYNTNESTAMSIELYIPSAWATTGRRMAGFWATAQDATNATSDYPIIEFTSTIGDPDGSGPRFRVWNNSGWHYLGLPSGFTYDSWYTLNFALVDGDLVYNVGDLNMTLPGAASTKMVNVILQGHNTDTPGVTYDIYWDNLTIIGGDPNYVNTQSVGITVADASGADAVTVLDNSISNSFYGYVLSDVNTTTRTTVDGGTVTGCMQGVSVFNVTLEGPLALVPSTVGVSNVAMSAFAGDYPSIPAANFHAGIYAYTGGPDPAAVVDLLVDNVSITGTGNHAPNSAGIYMADFSSGAGNRLNAVFNDCTVDDNLNRGVYATGGNVTLAVNTSDITGNGSDPHGTGGNDGYGVIARNGADISIQNCFVTNPATVTAPYNVFGISNNGASASTITANNNSLDNNANPDGQLLYNGNGTMDMTCNWWGSGDVDDVDAAIPMQPGITFLPYLNNGTDDAPGTAGFQPVSGSCVNPDKYYVNDLDLSGDVYTTAIGDDANFGTKSRPKLTINAAVAVASNTNTIYVDAGTYDEAVNVSTGLTMLGANAGVACGSRTAETIVASTSGTPFLVSADGVTIDGFEVSNPSGAYAISASGNNDLVIQFNNIHDVGGTSSGVNVHALVYSCSVNADNVVIADNCLTNIGAPTVAGKSVSAISVGFTNNNGVLTNLVIERNSVTNVSCSNAAWPAGKGAYGILMAVGGGTGSGSTDGAIVRNNEVIGLDGHWSHGIGLEGNTPNTQVLNNFIDDLASTKVPSDAIGIMVEQNSGIATVDINDNSFTNMGYAINNTMLDAPQSATCNWYGTNDPGAVLALHLGDVNFTPWLLDGTDALSGDIGFQPAAACAGYPVSLTVKAALQGPYNAGSGLMNDALRAGGLIPLSQPYNDPLLGYGYAGTETISDPGVLAVTGADAIVDWVLLELREQGNSTNVVKQLAALVQRDGDVVDVDGVSPIYLWDMPRDFYFVSVRHRNHLGVMGMNVEYLGTVPFILDFTTISTYGTDAQTQVAPGKNAMWSGNTRSDDLVKYTGPANDRDPILITIGGIIPTNVVSSYYGSEDVNMDGLVKYTGFNNDRDLILQNIGGIIPTAVLNQQLP